MTKLEELAIRYVKNRADEWAGNIEYQKEYYRDSKVRDEIALKAIAKNMVVLQDLGFEILREIENYVHDVFSGVIPNDNGLVIEYTYAEWEAILRWKIR